MRKSPEQPERRISQPAPQSGNPTADTGSLVAQHTAVQFSGPLPDPQNLQRYEQILPGSAERIMAMAETQLAHRIQNKRGQRKEHGKKTENASGAEGSGEQK